MDDDIIQNGRGSQHQPPIEGKSASAAAAAPTGFLAADGDRGNGRGDNMAIGFGIVSHPFRDVCFSSFPVSFFQCKCLIRRKVRCCRLLPFPLLEFR